MLQVRNARQGHWSLPGAGYIRFWTLQCKSAASWHACIGRANHRRSL